jgi:hypothetical protein
MAFEAPSCVDLDNYFIEADLRLAAFWINLPKTADQL